MLVDERELELKSKAKIPSSVRRCLRTIAAALAAHRAFRSPGQPPAPIASATCSRVCVRWWRRLSGTFGAGPRGRPDCQKVGLQCVRPRDRHFSRYSFLNTRSGDFPEIGDGVRGRYATLHVPKGVTHAMKGAPKSTNGSQAVRRSPFPHTQCFDDTPTRTE